MGKLILWLQDKLKDDKLKGSTLIETIVSMTLIGLIMTVVLTFLFTINRETGKPLAYFMVKCNINSIEEKYDTEFRDDGSAFTIVRSFKKYEGFDDLLLFEVKALDVEGKTIISARRIISAQTDEFDNKLYDE